MDLKYSLIEFEDLKRQLLFASSKLFKTIAILDSNVNNSSDLQGKYCYLAAIGVRENIELRNGNTQEFISRLSEKNDWVFGGFSYDFKNHWWNLSSENKFGEWPSAFFFVPRILVIISRQNPEEVIVKLDEEDLSLWNMLLSEEWDIEEVSEIDFKSDVNNEKYLEKVHEIKKDIKNGEYYELNYCIRFEAERKVIHPPSVFNELNRVSPNPFSAYIRWDNLYAMCSSPERFLIKKEQKLLSQPMKGTSRRFDDPKKDLESRQKLMDSIKDKAENVMIVDLVRNDLSRNCIAGTVVVDELCEVYSFPHVHQMISTVSGKLETENDGIKALLDSFPMGSMTGAPKMRVIEKIEEIETCSRDLYSGSVGYIEPNGDFDFNVMIRTLFYNEKNQKLVYNAGGAITSDSLPEEEYEEVLLKAEILKKLFNAI